MPLPRSRLRSQGPLADSMVVGSSQKARSTIHSMKAATKIKMIPHLRPFALIGTWAFILIHVFVHQVEDNQQASPSRRGSISHKVVLVL